MESNNQTEQTEKNLCAVLKNAAEVAVFSHMSPDGDTLGSMLAVGLSLEKMGKKVLFYNQDPVPANLAFLPGAERITSVLPSRWPEVLLFVDCADIQRTNLAPEIFPPYCMVLNLDHHISNTKFARYNWVEAEAAATGELAYQLIRCLGTDIDQAVATDLYTAIITDTGSFQYSNTRPVTHRIAADLLEKGIDLVKIHDAIYNQNPLAQVCLLGKALEGLKLYADGQLAVMTLTLEDFAACGAKQEMSEGLINHARGIAGVEVALMLREVEKSVIKASIRSNLWFDVNALALKFGGGGHYRAAGCTIRDNLSEAEKQLIAAIETGLKNGKRDH